MGPILIVAWLFAVVLGAWAVLYVGAMALGKAFSTGEDGDPPRDLTGS